MTETEEKQEPVTKTTRKTKPRGFYANALDKAERIDFELAAGVEGIDEEIALLRVKIKALVERNPENLKLVLKTTEQLTRMVRTRYNISGKDKKGLAGAVKTVLKDIALPLGVGIGTIIEKKG